LWRFSISTKFGLVARNNYRNGQNVSGENLLLRCKLLVAKVYFNKTFVGGAKQLSQHGNKTGSRGD
jgi:hypothetical protein